MQPTRPSQKKPVKFLDAKVLIATLSLASTVGMWNMFSHSALKADQNKVDPTTTPPPQPPAEGLDGLAPLPTLIPLVNVTTQQEVNTAQTAQQPAGQMPALRSVTAPTQVIVQKVKPVFDQPAAVVSGGGGGGGSSRSVTTTKSSR
jgi:hypothetical protein